MNPDAEMQKPSLGFDYLQRFARPSGDFASFALQFRLAFRVDGEEERNRRVKVEPQVYNAYLRVKTAPAYFWAGHNRPAFGLGSYFDSHALLLRTLAIQGFGYDRDWGVGATRDFSWGDISASATTGSGMPIYRHGNYMAAARVSCGVLRQENYNIGFSLGYGRTLDTMGYTLRESEPGDMRLAGLDFAILRDRIEHRLDALAGRWLGKDTRAALYRFGVNFGQEARIKLEAQPTYWKSGQEENYQMGLCGSYLATADLTVRLAYWYDYRPRDNRVILQLYYYLPL